MTSIMAWSLVVDTAGSAIKELKDNYSGPVTLHHVIKPESSIPLAETRYFASGVNLNDEVNFEEVTIELITDPSSALTKVILFTESAKANMEPSGEKVIKCWVTLPLKK